MKRGLLIALMAGIVSSAWAQHDDLYFVPKKKKVQAEVVDEPKEEPQEAAMVSDDKALSITTINIKGLDIDEDAYNRRGSYLTEEGDAVSELAMDDEGFVLITEEGDTLLMNTDTLRLTHLEDGEGWINGFDGSNSDYEYAMRIVRFRNPRYAIPVSSPLYWDVVYGGALWPSWQWNIYDDGMYAYVFPTSSNWYYSDYIMGYPYGWGGHWNYSWGYHWGGYWTYAGYHFGHVWYDPWYNPYFYDYYPGWHYGHHHHHHHGYFPGPGWGGVTVGPRPIHNDRHADIASTRRGLQSDNTVGRGAASTSRQSTTATRAGSGSTTRSSSVRVVTGRSGSTQSSGAVRSSSSRSGSDEVLRRSGTTSSVTFQILVKALPTK